MGAPSDLANVVYADGPSGSPNEPKKSDIRELWRVADDAIAGAAAGEVSMATWTALAAITGTRAGQPGRVAATDGGTHTDPVVGGTVNNAGVYSWSASPAGWRRLSNLPSSDVQAVINGAAAKATLADADNFGVTDSAASNVIKKHTWGNLKAGVWTALGALIAGGTVKATLADADVFAIGDSAASNASKKLTFANLKSSVWGAIGSIASVPLTVDGGSTANALIGTLPSGFSSLTLQTGTLIHITPTVANTGAVTITVGGVLRNLRDAAGAALGAGFLKPDVPVTAIVTGASEARIIGQNQDGIIMAGGPLTNGADINTITAPGFYYGDSAHTYVNAPTAVSGQQWFLEVRASKGGSDNLRRWVVQKAWIAPSMASPYSRRIDALNPGATVAWGLIGGGYIGSFTGVDMSTLTTPGLYLIGMAGVPDKPDGFAGTTGLLEVRAYGTYVVQTLSYPLEPVVGWKRTVRPGPLVYDWYRAISGGAGGTSYADGRAVFFGDSIVANSDYPARVGDRLGLTEAINAGFGGARMGPGGTLEAFSMVSLADAIESGDWSTITTFAEDYFTDTGIDVRPKVALLAALDWETVGYICIAYSSNDWANGVPIGTATDSGTATISGSTNTALQAILTAYPHLRVMLITPSWRARQTVGDGKDSDAFPNSVSGEYLIEVVDGLLAIAERWHIPACDLYRTMGLNSYTYAEYLRDQTIDGLHPYGATGAKLFADRVGSAFASVF